MKELYRQTVGGFKLIADRAVSDEDGNNIKTTKQNHNIPETTTVDDGMNLLATTSTGDIVRTTLAFDTSSVDKFLSQTGEWLTVSPGGVSDSWKYWSSQHGSLGDDDSIYIGSNNLSYGKSILFGLNNTTSSESGAHNQATILGYGNTAISHLASLAKTTTGLVYGIPLEKQTEICGYEDDWMTALHNSNLAGLQTADQSIYTILCEYVSDPELDASYTALSNATTGPEYMEIYEGSAYQTYVRTIYNAKYATPPGYGPVAITYDCNSIIMGVNNTANHYNSILLGTMNTSLAPAEEVANTDDDGFTVAIGFKNTVERNYDMAIGYQSVAKGGENIAITNSEAIGYRNLAYNHSKVNGICNILLNESVLDCKRWDDEPLKIEYNTFNTLNNSNVSYKCVTESESNTGVTFFGNHFEGVRCELVASDWGVHANVMLGNGPRIDESYSTWSNDPDIKIAAGTISNNIIADSKQHFEIALGNKDSSNSIEQNLFMFNDVQMHNIKQLRQNMFISSVFNVEMDSNAIGKGYFYDNIIANSTVTGRLEGSTLVPGGVKANTINHNVILGKSNLYLNNTPGTVEFNVLIGNSTLDAYHENPIWSNSTDGIKCNFLFGSSGRKIHDCVSFGDGGGAYLENAMHSRNFGDNTLYNANKVFVSGDGNALNAVQHSVVFGESNEFNSDEYDGRRDLSSAGDIHMSEIFVHGISNKFNYTGGSDFFSRLFVAGNGNTVNGNNVHDSSILGSNNTIGWFENGVPVKKTCDEVWSLNVSVPTIIEVTDKGYLPPNGTSTVNVWSDYYYYYRGGAAYAVYSTPESYTSISGNDFVQKVRNKELVDNSYYYITSSVQGDNAVLQLNANIYYLCAYYTKYPDGTVRSTSLANMGTHILGCQDKIAPNVMWSTILGAEHKVTNSLPYGISGLLVQGMNQTVSDGSNIICMGAGNVSSGHGSIAIGNQLISDKWQTVIGKYNEALPGPERIIPKHDENKTYNAGDIVYDSLGSTYYKCTSSVPTVGMIQNSLWTEVDPDSEKALFIVGNGYGESDGSGDWNDETKIHRSNAMVVYADGTVKAKKFVSDEPEMELTEGTGITIEKSVSSGTVTISLKQPLPATPSNQGTYALQCVVDSNGEPTLSWVAIGISNV